MFDPSGGQSVSPSQRDFGDYANPKNLNSSATSLTPSQRDFGSYPENNDATNDDKDQLPSTLDKIGAGAEHGTLSVPKTVGRTAGTFIAKQLGATPEAVAKEKSKWADEESAYQKKYGDSDIAEAASIPGQVLAALPYLATGGNAVGALGDATSMVAPYVPATIEDFAGKNMLTRLGTRAATGAAQGAGFNALTGNSPISGGEVGAVLNGAVGPAIGNSAKYVYNKAGALLQPLTDAGRTSIANKIVQGYGEDPLKINSTELVPGSKPTLAEATGNPGIAQLQDTLRDNNSKQFFEREGANANARNDALTNAAGTPQDIQAAQTQRAAAAEQALGNPAKGIPSQLFTNAQSVSTDPVKSKIDQILAGESGNRPAVAQSMDAVKGMLNDSKGAPITDPATLYHSVRKGIGDLLDKKNLSNPAGQQAAAQLGEVRDSLDDAIEQGAPGFKNYLSDYTQASSPINAMKWMQGLNLKDANGNITLSGVQNALKNATKLQNTPGVNSAKNLSSDQVTTLQNIRDDLLRKQNLTAGKSYGSPTVQKATAQNKLQNVLDNSNYNLFSSKVPLEAWGAGVGGAAAHRLGIPIDMGAAAGGAAAASLKKGIANKNALIRDKLQNIMLNPNSYVPPSAPTGSNLLNNPMLTYGAVPTMLSGINSLSNPVRP